MRVDLHCKAVQSMETIVLNVFLYTYCRHDWHEEVWPAWVMQPASGWDSLETQHLLLAFPDFEHMSKSTTDFFMPNNTHDLLSVAGKPGGMNHWCLRGLVGPPQMPAPFHLLPRDLLARGAVGDLISQLISLLLSMSAGSLRWGKFLNTFRPWFKLWPLIVSSNVKSDNACRL